jgi:hypothetical protein
MSTAVFGSDDMPARTKAARNGKQAELIQTILWPTKEKHNQKE